MTTRFSKQKLVETQEKKARSGIVGGFLSRKRQKVGDAPSRVPVVTPPFAHSPIKRPPSPTLSLPEENLLANLFGMILTLLH